MKKANRNKTKTRSNAFGNRLNAFDWSFKRVCVFPYSTFFIRKVTYNSHITLSPSISKLFHSVVKSKRSFPVQDGRIFIVDNKILEDIPHFGHDDPEVERRYTSASMGLFYARNDGELVPIAIQMHQEPSDTNPIWTPKDAEYDWLYAKMCLRNADSQYHQVRVFRPLKLEKVKKVHSPSFLKGNVSVMNW